MEVAIQPSKQRTKEPAAPVDFVILTALDEERDAVLSKLRGARKLDKDAADVTTYYAATVRSTRQDRSTYQVIVTSLLHMGPINGAAQAVAVVRRWKPRYVLLVGIACGVRGEVQLGDVLIATQVADYTLGKQVNGRRQVRWEVFPCGASLLDSANNVAARWEKTIGIARPGTSTVVRHKGVVASGGDVISDDQVIATYSESWPKLIGIEMEGGGVAAGVHQTPDRPEFLMIKSVSDFGRDKHDAEVKPWRPYACHAAAAFALALIKSGPARSLSEIVERAQSASAEEAQRQAAERRWQYIQSHPIRAIEILFLLKSVVGSQWFRELLNDTRLTFSRDRSFKLGQLLADAPTPNTRQRSRVLETPVCSFWQLYELEPGYWVRRIAPDARELSVVAGFDADAPWSVLGLQNVRNLEDLALLTELGVSIPARAYQVGVEEFVLRFMGDTFSFSVKLSETAVFDVLHEFARKRYTVGAKGDDDPMPVGTGFGGVQLLDMFLRQSLPSPAHEQSAKGIGMLGLSGPDGNAIMFYPTMPPGFQSTPESEEYTFMIPGITEFDTAARIRELEQQLVTNPGDVDLYLELATGYLYEGRLSDVIRCLETAITAAPPSGNIHALLSQALRQVGRFDEALAHARTSVALAPDDVRMQAEVGAGLAELGQLDAALPYFQAAAQGAPSNPGYQTNLCVTFARLNRHAEAIGPARRAVELLPDDFRSAFWLSILLNLDGAREEALLYLERAARNTPDSAAAHHEVGEHFARLEQHERAVVSLQRSVEIEETTRRWELLGASLAALERWPEAEAAFRRRLDLEPDTDMRLNLGIIVERLDRYAEAEELFEEALRDDPTNARAQQLLADLRSAIAAEDHGDG